MALLREFCAENVERVPAAIAAGAGRIELCDNLAVGGTSPSYGVIRAAVGIARETGAAVMAMARPRGGNFVYTAAEEQIMLDDVAMARSLGVDGVVFGCLTADGASGEAVVDRDMTARLVEAAHGSVSDEAGTEVPPVAATFHMAFDELSEERQLEAIDFLAGLGVERILTHGGAAGTPIADNLGRLGRLIEHAAGRLTILPGGGITFENAESVAEALGVQEVHGTKIVKLA
ncbi:copper homeostasis protein CutC [Thermophilibacter sp.]|uniref:copper homeostasis protein CutC n=1 Tax=Thermophilibacter sp. TaxID=2847309 RepID=UPI003A907A52